LIRKSVFLNERVIILRSPHHHLSRKSIGKKKNSTIRSPVKKKKSPIKGKSTGKITQNIETQKAAAVQKQISPKHAEVVLLCYEYYSFHNVLFLQTKGTVTIKWNHYTEEISFEVPPGIPLKTVDELFLASESYPNCTIHLQPTVVVLTITMPYLLH